MSSNFLDPSVAAAKTVPMAKRPESLAGKVVGLYDNTKEQADIILEVLAGELPRKYGAKAVMARRGVHYSRPAPKEIIEEMAAGCDAVVCALGG